MPEPLTVWVQTSEGMQELPPLAAGGGGDVDAHIADTVDAHDASAVSFVPTGSIAATDVQSAIVEVAAEAAGAAISEVEISATDPIGTNPSAELWYDTDAAAPGGPAWSGVTLLGAWVNFGSTFSAPQYRKVGDIVYLRGMIKSGAVGTAAFTLPSGFRPLTSEIFVVMSNDSTGQVQIATSGNVTPSLPSSTNWVSLSGIAFSVSA